MKREVEKKHGIPIKIKGYNRKSRDPFGRANVTPSIYRVEGETHHHKWGHRNVQPTDGTSVDATVQPEFSSFDNPLETVVEIQGQLVPEHLGQEHNYRRLIEELEETDFREIPHTHEVLAGYSNENSRYFINGSTIVQVGPQGQKIAVKELERRSETRVDETTRQAISVVMSRAKPARMLNGYDEPIDPEYVAALIQPQ